MILIKLCVETYKITLRNKSINDSINSKSEIMNILILGGTSFIGYFVTRRLLNAGHKVTLFNRGNKSPDFISDVDHIKGDKVDLLSFKKKFEKMKPDVILDMVPLGDKDSLDVMDVAKGVTERVVAISSCDVYRAYGRLLGSEPGEPDITPLTEDSPLREILYPYKDNTDNERLKSYDKILVEKNVMNDEAVRGTILRLPMVYGPRDYQFRFIQYLQRMDDERGYILLDEDSAKWKTNRAYVEDIANGIALAIENENASGQVFNISEENALTEIEFVQKIAKYTGWKGEVLVYKNEEASDYKRQDLVTDSSKIREVIGYKEITREDDAYTNTIEWERNNKPKGFKIDYTEDDKILENIKSN